MANELILKQIQNIELSDLKDKKIIALHQNIITNINLNEIKKQVISICRNLSQVTSFSFGADLKYIAKDNQQRLELIFQLLDSLIMFEEDVKCFRKNKNNCNDNYDYIFSFLLRTQDLANAILCNSNSKD